MKREPDLTREEIRALSIRAVNQLIADVEAKRLLENKELAETIAVCIRHSPQAKLKTLKWLLNQRELEGIPALLEQPLKPRWQN
jgi:hypothetical protein